MPIHLIADTPARLAAVRAVLERRHAVTSELLLGPGIQRSNIEALVIHVDLRNIQKICVGITGLRAGRHQRPAWPDQSTEIAEGIRRAHSRCGADAGARLVGGGRVFALHAGSVNRSTAGD